MKLLKLDIQLFAEEKVKRSRFASFLNTGTKETPIWSRIGKGVATQTINYNGTTSEEFRIDEDSADNDVESYAPTMDTPQTAYAGNPVFDYVDNLRIKRAIGTDAVSEVLLVYMYKPEGETGNVFVSERNDCSLLIGDFGGDGGNSNVLNYTINLKGDPKHGVVTITDKKPVFTETGVA